MSDYCRFAIFGAAGHLAATKLLPSLYDLQAAGRLGDALHFVALARRDWNTAQWREHLHELLARAGRQDTETVRRFAARFDFLAGDNDDPALYRKLFDTVSRRPDGGSENLVLYLAIPPEGFLNVVRRLAEAGLNDESSRHRIVIEKPFGHDLESAQRLNAEL
ncbi:MAG TPA: glucose-6-phosphate dehydrogenase, partial [Gammaproteobacteria bacterium]|nr:glucose-6-phosphate dehydrogenase [Gammaproteobacteria bacterium]